MPGQHPQQRLPRRVERERPGQSEADGFAAGLAGGTGEHLGAVAVEEVDQPAVGYDDTLRSAGGAGRVDHVGDRLGCQRTALRVVERSIGHGVEVEILEHDTLRRPRHLGDPVVGRAGGEDADGVGGAEDVGEAFEGLVDVERDVGGAGLEDGVDRDQRVDGAGQREGDPRVRPVEIEVRDEVAGQTVHPRTELRVGERHMGVRSGRCVGGRLDPFP